MHWLTGLFGVVILGMLVGCYSKSTQQLELNKAVVRQLVEAVNGRDHDLLDEIMTSDFVRHCQATPQYRIKSVEEMKQFLRQDLEVFPDGRVEVEMLIAEGDKVAGYFEYSGTQSGAMGPFPATDKRAAVKYLSILRFEEGEIAEMWIEWDNLAILSQLGHKPLQAPADE